MKNKYNEPWTCRKYLGDTETQDSAGEAILTEDYNSCVTTDERRQRRIVACVNAMVGIEDPAAFVKEAKEVGTVIKMGDSTVHLGKPDEKDIWRGDGAENYYTLDEEKINLDKKPDV